MERPGGPPPLDDDRVEELRSQLPGLSAGAYLNTGTAGPLPTPVSGAMHAELARQLTVPRSGPEHLERYLALGSAGRTALSSVLGCDQTEIALTHSTTEAMTLVTMGIDWRAGDEAVTTSLEHPGALFPLFVARERFGITIRVADLDGLDDDAITTAISAEVTERTRLVSMSHVSFQNGQLLPVRAIADAVRPGGALLLVDGAQSAGAIEVDVTALGCDAFAFSGQKWLLGPEGTGGLFARRETYQSLGVIAASYGTAEQYDRGGFTLHRDSRRLEFGTTNPVQWAGQIAAIEFLRDSVGVAAASKRATGLADLAITRLGALSGVTVCTPRDRHATLVTAAIAGVDPFLATEALARRGVLVRAIRELGAIRLSLAFFTTADEIDRAVAAVGDLARDAH